MKHDEKWKKQVKTEACRDPRGANRQSDRGEVGAQRLYKEAGVLNSGVTH